MNAEVTVQGEVAILRVAGELDAYTGPDVRDQLHATLASGARWILVDLLATEFIDSMFLGILVGGGKLVGEKDGDITVVCDRSHLLRVFDISGTRELLNVVGSREEAEDLINEWQSQCKASEAGAEGAN